MKKQHIYVLFFFATTIMLGQECDCNENYRWLKTTFEQNDAGYQAVIDKKGEKAYDAHNLITQKRVSNITDLHACVKELQNWSHFFRSGHIGIANLKLTPNSNAVFSHQINVAEFKKNISNKEAKDIEGIWNLNGEEIAFKKVDNQYFGILIKTDNPNWRPFEVKFVINEDGTGDFFTEDKQRWDFKKHQLLTDDLLNINGYLYLRRTSIDKDVNHIAVNLFIKNMQTRSPSAYKYNDSTYYIRIPSFNWQHKAKIDSVIQLHKDAILNTKNLIVDIRGNGGGSDASYKELLPFIYTNPIKKPGFEFRSTSLNNNRTLEIIDGKFGALSNEEILEQKKRYSVLSKNLETYVNFEAPEQVATITLNTVSNYPKNVAILINEGNGSTAEEFLLAAKQSKKVKLYGINTSGALDASNMYTVESPNKEILLIYTLSRRINNMPIDDIGIQPDFYLDNTIKRYNWIEYVSKNL